MDSKSTDLVFGGQNEVLRLVPDSPEFITPTLNFSGNSWKFIFYRSFLLLVASPLFPYFGVQRRKPTGCYMFGLNYQYSAC